ncbi:MAG: aminotransferase class I/II-fold pyridoxal phosphate-dependent enzyme [Rhodobacteraceae bacterium]|nr:aminotransferase class I/II-fold pyridoxal phosphate-dependent enzyme [Paracoccaceae bacterium]
MGVTLAKSGIDRIRPHMLVAESSDPKPPWALLHSNESVFGPSPLAREAARASVSDIERYLEFPDHILAPAIGECFNLDANRIITGQGSDDLLARLARAYLGPGDQLIRSANGYLKVPNYAHANDAEPVSVADDNLVPSVDNMIAALTERTKIVYLANPENPAGTYLNGAEIRRLHAALPDHVLLVLDNAYEEYVDASDYEPGHLLVEEANNVIMCRTFSKIYGLAGARVGWAFGPEDVIDVLRRIGLTFPVASPSAAAVIAAMQDPEHIRYVFEQNRAGRNFLADQVIQLGLNVVPSQANFMLIHMPDSEFSAAKAEAFLLNRGILIRRLNAPAYKDYIRVTIGMRHQLEAVVAGLRDFLAGGE